MSFYTAPWNNNLEPSQGNIRQWLDNLYTKFQPIEQARWNQSNIDTLFYAGAQSYVNRYFNFSPTTSFQQYYFNLIQQPINLITGYQRQHRKSLVYIPTEGSDSDTTDQYTKMITHVANAGCVHEQFSKACELAAVSGMVLMQPYLDYLGDDPAQGQMKVKIWEYNSFLVDPYFREPDMSDAQFVWCQEYITKQQAQDRFPDQQEKIKPMSGAPQRYGNFYFLPENYNMARNDLMVLSYVWYKWKRQKKRLYSRSRNQFFDYAGDDGHLEMLLYSIPDMEEVTVEVPCWKLAVVLNDQLMYEGENPLGFDGCPFIPVFWNYEPHINYYDLRVRSLVRPMRDPQFLFNYKIINNHDIAAATKNAGWKRKSGAVANEDGLRTAENGTDIIINEGYELVDVEKIIPSAVPQSDLELGKQMAELIFNTSGIDMENWAAQQDKQSSSLTVMLKQAANLLVFQKYFDQWDLSLKLLGERMLQIGLHNWNASKVKLLIGEDPTAYFYSRVFAKFNVLCEEGDLTPTQQNMQAQQMLDVNQAFGREVIPPSMIIPKLNIQGKSEIIAFLQQQEQQMASANEENQVIQQTILEAQLKEAYSRAASNIALARERHGRAEANIGLFEERLSEITQNRAMATKAKMEAIEKLVDVVAKYGEIETALSANKLQRYDNYQEGREQIEKEDAKRTSLANEFFTRIMGEQGQGQVAPHMQGQPMQNFENGV